MERKNNRIGGWHSERARGFTIIELLVVVSIIALLISILLPALAEARRDARAVTCSAQLHHVGQAVAIYNGRNKGMLPASYLYACDEKGNWRLKDQYYGFENPYGYIHWSYFMYNEGRVDEKSFQCPEIEHGGHPRTNPGPDPADWVGSQMDDLQNTSSGQTQDKQATWMAYTSNAALMPRNKFFDTGDNMRVNQFVNESAVRGASRTILATEFAKQFNAVAEKKTDTTYLLSKSHRSVHPFYDRFLGGFNVYASNTGKDRNLNTAVFYYGAIKPDSSQKAGGILEMGEWENTDNIISDEYGSTINKLNAVGRHHPGTGPKEFGGTANFLFLDGHVDRDNVLQTMLKRQWGDRFYSIEGNNAVNMTLSFDHVMTNYKWYEGNE